MDFQEFIQNKANELVSLDWPDDMILSFIDGAEQVKNYFGWHPANKLPELNEYGNSEPVYALYGTNNSRLLPMISFVIEGKWHDNNIKWWCYPPKED